MKGATTPRMAQANPSRGVAPIPRLALTREEAAAAIGMSLDSFERYCQPTLRLIRCGRMRLVAVAELGRWLDENSARVLEEAKR